MSGSTLPWRRIAKWVTILLLAPPLLFFIAAWIGSSIPRNGDWTEPDQGVEIFVGSNGVHTELVFPVATDIVDWRGVFPVGDVPANGRDYTHVSIGWGEKVFFLETPTWADVKPGTVLNAMTGGQGVLHVSWYVRPAPSDDFRPMRVTREEYARLVEQVIAQLAPEDERTIYPGYFDYDVFYDARGTYHLGNTCNQWSSDRLAAAGIETGLWTPMTGGVMKWVPDLPQSE